MEDRRANEPWKRSYATRGSDGVELGLEGMKPAVVVIVCKPDGVSEADVGAHNLVAYCCEFRGRRSRCRSRELKKVELGCRSMGSQC